jgi:hypothetical protein
MLARLPVTFSHAGLGAALGGSEQSGVIGPELVDAPVEVEPLPVGVLPVAVLVWV